MSKSENSEGSVLSGRAGQKANSSSERDVFPKSKKTENGEIVDTDGELPFGGGDQHPSPKPKCVGKDSFFYKIS